MGVYFNKEEELEHRIELLEIAMGNMQLAMGESNNKEKAKSPTNSTNCSCDLPNYVGLSLDKNKPCPYCKLPFKKY